MPYNIYASLYVFMCIVKNFITYKYFFYLEKYETKRKKNLIYIF